MIKKLYNNKNIIIARIYTTKCNRDVVRIGKTRASTENPVFKIEKNQRTCNESAVFRSLGSTELSKEFSFFRQEGHVT